jgi:hypothetical protein
MMQRFLVVGSLFAAFLWMSTAAGVPAQTALRVDDVPAFEIRARILSIGGWPPGQRRFPLTLGVPAPAGTAVGGAWSNPIRFDRPQAEATLRGYPAVYLHGYPVVVLLRVGGVVDPTSVQVELRFSEGGAPLILPGELFGPSLGILVWRDDSGKARAATMAGYNQRYWKALRGLDLPKSQRPKRFPLVDRFIGGDDDRTDWGEGIEQLARAGLTAVMLPPSHPIHEVLIKAGLHRTAWAVYNPPGYAFDYGAGVTPQAIDAWAQQQARPYFDAGYTRQDMALFAMSDEPGWYFPSMFSALTANSSAMDRFRGYLKSQGLVPADVGASRWDDVLPAGRTGARDLPSRRLFYWTARFFSWDSSRHFARCTRALESAFYPNLPVLTNWNFFSGRLYVPGPVANNPVKHSPDAAMGGHDWLEFGRMRGGTLLGTEDWFPDSMASQWSLYCARLRSAARKSGVRFGGYVVPRAAGDTTDGVLQKALCIAGSGGKAIEYYTFGPEYNFPGNCYSERPLLLRKIAEANRLIGRAEDLLWPGQPPRAAVGRQKRTALRPHPGCDQYQLEWLNRRLHGRGGGSLSRPAAPEYPGRLRRRGRSLALSARALPGPLRDGAGHSRGGPKRDRRLGARWRNTGECNRRRRPGPLRRAVWGSERSDGSY